jgi:hypothetical protein
MSKSKDAPVEPVAVAELRPFEAWAALRGHVPTKRVPKFRGDFHRGPHIDVVFTRARLVHGLARNSPITGEAYDKLVDEAYSLPIGET